MDGLFRMACGLAAVSVLAGTMQAAPTPLPGAVEWAAPAASAPPSPLQVQVPQDGGPTTPRIPSAPQAGGPDCRKLKCVALTMDDGPVAQTADVLALLRAEKVHATFFLIGANARRYPALVRRMLADGNAVGNHSWDHPQFWHLSEKAIGKELSRTDALLKKITGKRPTLVRPPYGEVDGKVRKVATSGGQTLILWDVDPQDWKDRDAKVVAKRVLGHARRNSIILSHDIWPSTRQAYAKIIRGLKAKGFTLVTVPQLLAGRMKPGKVFTHG